ncbi:MAG: 30S ribosomal protein S16 [Rhodothermia bacterium]|nr:30S ribosomal protein S16 [Rhodothermia bacterium]
MAVKLRLRRMGRSKRPLYGIVAADSRARRDGRFIEDLGRYNPIPEPAEITINEDRLMYWLREGAEPSDTVRAILSSRGLLLRLHLERKGKTAEEIEQELDSWKAAKAGKSRSLNVTKADRVREAFAKEKQQAEEKAAELAKLRAEAEARAKAEAEAARAAAEAARAAAAAEAAAAQEAANAVAAAADEAVADAAAETTAEA